MKRCLGLLLRFFLYGTLFTLMVILPGYSKNNSEIEGSGALNVEEPAAKTQKAREQHRKAQLEAQRKERIQKVRDMFQTAAVQEKSQPQKSIWTDEVRGEKKQVAFSMICAELKRLYNMHDIIQELNSDKSETIHWSDLGMDATAGKAAYKKTAIDVTKSLLGIFSLSHDLREKAEPCLTLVDIKFTNSSSVMQSVLIVLEMAGLEPQDIDSTPTILRQTLLKDFRSIIAELRSISKLDEDAKAITRDEIIAIARDAINNWNFTWRELGLTPEENIRLKNHY